VTQHATLTLERWSTFQTDDQILMIANELHRAGKLTAPDDRQRLLNALERVLHLTDLTIQAATRRALRRELLRWRDLAASLYAEPAFDAGAHRAALHCLLRFTFEASRQIAV
jgi:hypothetical protein